MPFPDFKGRGPWYWRISQPQCQSKFCCTRVYTCKQNRTKPSPPPPSPAFPGLRLTPQKGGVRRWRGAGAKRFGARQAKRGALEHQDRFSRLLRRVLSVPSCPGSLFLFVVGDRKAGARSGRRLFWAVWLRPEQSGLGQPQSLKEGVIALPLDALGGRVAGGCPKQLVRVVARSVLLLQSQPSGR